MAENDVNDTERLNSIQFVDNQERQYFAQAQLGQQVKDFLISPSGRYLHARCKMEYEDAKEQMLGCNLQRWYGRRKAERLQTEANQASRFMRYLSDALIEGESAGNALLEYRD